MKLNEIIEAVQDWTIVGTAKTEDEAIEFTRKDPTNRYWAHRDDQIVMVERK